MNQFSSHVVLSKTTVTSGQRFKPDKWIVTSEQPFNNSCHGGETAMEEGGDELTKKFSDTSTWRRTSIARLCLNALQIRRALVFRSELRRELPMSCLFATSPSMSSRFSKDVFYKPAFFVAPTLHATVAYLFSDSSLF